jgi:hypothetical protein
MKGLFNPGGARASYATAEKGISPLPCRPRSSTEVESIIAFQQATNESEANRTLADAMKMSSAEAAPRSPPMDYYDLCTMLGTFAALLFALFGAGCDFFASVFDLYNILISDRVVDIKGCFTSLYCKQITWAVIEEGRTFFGTKLHPSCFTPGYKGTIVWPSSLLSKINECVIFGLPVIRQTFPLAWAEIQQKPQALTASLPPAPTKQQPPPPNPFANPPRAQLPALSPNSLTHVHPNIRKLLKPHQERLGGQIPMKKILKLSQKDFPDLPKLNRCIHGGKNKLCYQYICGICPRGEECYMHKEAQGHPNYSELDCVDPATGEQFVDHLWRVIQPGVEYIAKNGDEFSPVQSGKGNNKRKRNSGGGGAAT